MTSRALHWPKSDLFWCWCRLLQCRPAVVMTRPGGVREVTEQHMLDLQAGPPVFLGLPFQKTLLSQEADQARSSRQGAGLGSEVGMVPGNRGSRTGVPLKPKPHSWAILVASTWLPQPGALIPTCVSLLLTMRSWEKGSSGLQMLRAEVISLCGLWSPPPGHPTPHWGLSPGPGTRPQAMMLGT